MKVTRIAASIAIAALSLTACGGAETKATPPETKVTAKVEKKAPYEHPSQMVNKTVGHVSFDFECDNPEEADYQINGNLALACYANTGDPNTDDDDETIYLSTFEDPAVGDLLAEEPFPGAKVHVGDGWAVSAYSQAHLNELVKDLS